MARAASCAARNSLAAVEGVAKLYDELPQSMDRKIVRFSGSATVFKETMYCLR